MDTSYFSDGSGNTSCAGAAYTWNAEEQITCALGAAYSYDGDGVRVMKSGGDAAATLYWGAGTLAESDLSGNFTSEYIYLGGKRIARRDLATGNVYYYFSDELGSANVVATAAGALENSSDFYPYGGEDVITQNLANQKYKFEGKERDPESASVAQPQGLDDFGARFDSSAMGRFMSPDWANKPEPVPYAKLTNPQSLNLYAFTQNNPESAPDLDGHHPQDLWDGDGPHQRATFCDFGISADCDAFENDDSTPLPPDSDESSVVIWNLFGGAGGGPPQGPTTTVVVHAYKWWQIGKKLKGWWDEGSQLHREWKEYKLWSGLAKRDAKLLANWDPISDALTGSGSPTGESLDLVKARYTYEFAVASQGLSQIAKDMIHDTDSFGLPESRLGGAAVEQMRAISSGFADGSISSSVREAEQEYVQALSVENQ